MTLSDAVRRAAARLEAAGIGRDDARFDADLLARHVLGWDTAVWLVRQREPAPAGFQPAFDAAVERRRTREPVAYITGTREFYGRPFVVSRDVLIPRPETELVIDEAKRAVAELAASRQRQLEVADVGTGSGCLAITIALECPDVNVVASDISTAALTVARQNARVFNVGDAGDASRRVTFEATALTGGAIDRFDLVVSNPPYVAEPDRYDMQPDVRDFEPALALFGGDDGLDVIRLLIPAAEQALKAGGVFLMEMGAGQSNAVRALVARSTGLEEVRIVPDLAGIPRVLVAAKRAAFA